MRRPGQLPRPWPGRERAGQDDPVLVGDPAARLRAEDPRHGVDQRLSQRGLVYSGHAALLLGCLGNKTYHSVRSADHQCVIAATGAVAVSATRRRIGGIGPGNAA